MPEWKMHEFWAKKMDIPSSVSNYVSKLIDFPREADDEFTLFCKRHYPCPLPAPHDSILGFMGHDGGRANKAIREAQLKYLQPKGRDYVMAYYLHQFLDYIEWWDSVRKKEESMEGILSEERIERKIGSLEDQNLQGVRDFVMGHLEAIIWRLRHPLI